jgi:hypothetical protein
LNGMELVITKRQKYKNQNLFSLRIAALHDSLYSSIFAMNSS